MVEVVEEEVVCAVENNMPLLLPQRPEKKRVHIKM